MASTLTIWYNHFFTCILGFLLLTKGLCATLMHRLSGRYNIRFSLLMFAAVLVCRLVTALLLFCVVLLWTGRPPLPRRQLLLFIVAGMIRGNVSWVQALQVHRQHPMFLTTRNMLHGAGIVRV
jgi:hypothetical protein